jgi:hypothetical protein
MMIYPPQPTLPPEGVFTDPELNFIDESPRGFFPDNQDSNWGYRRKIYTDEIQELFDQFALIYSEIFPQSSQTYLDEWEKAVGLPRNPANKTLAQRRVMVLSRLRGGPFTRTKRREIVESYITATFGDPILLLPPGVEMLVGGQQLFNEAGDLSQLYMILETITSFQYEVRIKIGLAIDQMGLERDLNHFTPAGIFIIYNYAWEGKFGTDSGSGLDQISLVTPIGRKIVSDDFGFGSEGVAYRVTDTGVGIDTAKLVFTKADTGSGIEGAVTLKVVLSVGDDPVTTEGITDRKIVLTDSGVGVDAGSKLGSDSGG